MRLTHRHVFAVVTLALTASCSGYESNPVSFTGDSRVVLVLSPGIDTVPEAKSKTLTARVTDLAGVPQSAPVAWKSTDPGIASVSNGVVSGVSPGVASVIASTPGAADTASIVVTQSDLVLDVQPSAAAVAVGDTIDFVATLRTRSGDLVSVNSFNWSLSDTSAAQLVGAGSLRARREGELSVSAVAMARRGNSMVRIFRTPVASVTITPSTASVYRGSTLTLIPTLRDENGRLVENKITWGSSDYTKATVTQDGIVTGVGVGSVVITATSDAHTGSATINVMSPAAAAVKLTLPSSTLLVGSEMQAAAIPTDASGAPVGGKTIVWQSANPSIATVSPTGMLKGLAEGNVSVSATVDGVAASQSLAVKARKATSITITPTAPAVTAGQQAPLAAQVLDQIGSEMIGQEVAWSSANPSVATVSASGLLQGVAAGSTVIRATSGLLSTSVTATVLNTPVASVRISPASLSLTAGGQATLIAEALDANQNVLVGRVVRWSSQNATIATVTNGGVVTAVAAGSTNLIAKIEGTSASISITVSPAPLSPVAAITVSLASPTLSPGGKTQATATLVDASGKTLTGRVISWRSLDTSVAKVDSISGMVTAYAGGTVAILARSENVSGSASLTVSTPTTTVAKVGMTVPTQDLKVGQEVQLVVTSYDATGNVLTGLTILYSTEDASVVTVSSSGIVKGVGSGSTRIKATSGGITTAETFRLAAVLTSISISPATSTLSVGQTTQAVAVAKDAQGQPMTGPSFTWTTSNAAVASVSGTGLITAVGAGTATIHAAASGVTGSMTVTVLPPAPSSAVVASVSVSLSPASIVVGGTSQATALVKDAQGAIITGKPVSWSLGGSSLASVSSSGLVSGLAAGMVQVSATVDGVSGSSSLTIADPLSPPAGSAIVELPRTYLSFSYPVKKGQTIVVPPGGNLQTALNSAQRGDEIVLTAGATYSGNFTLPTKAGTLANGWIVIRSDKLDQLGPVGTRVTPADAAMMARIETPNVAPAIKTVGATSGWWIAGLEVTVTPSLTAQQYGLVNLGDASSQQNTLASVPTDLVLDRMYIHARSTTQISRCVALNSARTQVSDSYITECHGKGFDAQAIWGGNGPGPFKILNNTLTGSGENIMFGGSDPAIPGLVPSDIEIRRNYIYTPVSWKGIWTRKNLIEFKNASRVLIEANVLDGSWADAQTGWAVIMKSANQYGGCRWCRTTDVTMRRNLIRNAAAGINIAARGDNPATDTTARRILVSEVVLENIGVAPFTGEGRGMQLLQQTAFITLERTVLAGTLNAAMMLDKLPGSYAPVFRDNVWAKGSYGVVASGTAAGTNSLNVGAPGWTWTNMTLIGASQSGYPTGTTFLASEGLAPLSSQIRSVVAQAVAGVVIP